MQVIVDEVLVAGDTLPLVRVHVHSLALAVVDPAHDVNVVFEVEC